MLKAYAEFWKGYANWTGRAKRSEWWWVFLWNFVIGIILVIPSAPFISYVFENYGASTASASSSDALINSGFNPTISTLFFFLLLVYAIATIVPNISLSIRRLRDAGLPWGLYFLSFIPFFGGLIIFILMQLPTKK